MTKDDIENIVKRYKYISKAVENNADIVIIYISKRKYKIVITDKTIAVCKIIEDIKSKIPVDWLSTMVNGILNGVPDIWLIVNLPCECTMYYTIKRNFINLVYNCCIAKGLVSYEESLKENIA